jgi:hypothetical protein
MKKSILMLAFTAIVGASFALAAGQEAPKKDCTTKKACCKKDGKSCDKDKKTETKTTDTKTTDTKTEIKK